MAFITDEDYAVVIGDKALQAISQMDGTIRAAAIADAVEEVSGYLRGTYDVERIFGMEGEARNRLLVMVTCDVALYHLSASMPGRIGADVRKERYDRAIRWLEDVRDGIVVPDLAKVADTAGGGSGVFSFRSDERLTHNW